MQKITWFLLVIGLVFIVSACQKEPFLELNSQNEINFSDHDGSHKISFATNNAWKASSTESWCKVFPASGEASGSGASITVTCEPNTTYDSRSCTVTVSSGGLTQSIKVSQETNLGLIISQSSFNLSSDAQTIEVEVEANVKYSIDIDPSCNDWIRHVTTRALSTNTLVFEVAANNTFYDRIGRITLRQTDGILAESLTISQKQMDIIFIINPEQVQLDSESQSVIFDIQTNTDYEFTIPEDARSWVSLSYLDNNSISLSVSENDSQNQRRTTVLFRIKNETIIGNLEIIQDPDDHYIPLTIEAISSGQIHIWNPLSLTIEYLKDSIWTSTNIEKISIDISDGESISFRGNNKTYASLTRYTNIRTTSDCYLYGNMMSLVSSDNYYTLSSVSENSFRNLFSGAELITNHPKRKILLSATSLAERCYDSMFLGCSYLTEAPELPATILAERCYDSMFRGCTSLTQAPVLPATTLAEGCYYGMFQECNNLSVAPALPSITLCQSCYAYMFYGCLNLKKAPVLPAFFLASNCYSYMFYDCLNLDYISVAFVSSKIYPTENWLAGVSFTGTFVKNSAATWDVADLNIPKGWDIEINDFGLPDSYIDNRALFGESGSYIELDNLFKNYSSIDHVFLDIANATWDDGLGGRQKLPRTIILIQTEAGKQESIDPLDGSPIYLPKNNLGFLTYRNNKTNLINDYNIYMNAILYFENGNTTTTEIVIPVLFTNP